MNINCGFCKNLIQDKQGKTDKNIILCHQCYGDILGNAPAMEQYGNWVDLDNAEVCLNCKTLITQANTYVQKSAWTGVGNHDIIVCDGCVEEFTTTVKDNSVHKLKELLDGLGTVE